MWFYLVVVVLVVLGIAGGVCAGGIFTIILVPLALIVLLSGLGYSLIARVGRQRTANVRALTDSVFWIVGGG